MPVEENCPIFLCLQTRAPELAPAARNTRSNLILETMSFTGLLGRLAAHTCNRFGGLLTASAFKVTLRLSFAFD